MIKLLFEYISVKQEVRTLDDEAIRVKEQAILEIGNLFAETNQPTGKSCKDTGQCLLSETPSHFTVVLSSLFLFHCV